MADFKVYKDYYQKGKVKYDRVTSILDYFQSPELVDWKLSKGRKQANEKSKVGKAIGTRVHNLIPTYNKIKMYSITPYDSQAVINCMKGYKEWFEIEKPNIIGEEITCFDDDLMIAGTLDQEHSDKIIDVKTSERINANHWLQVAMYNYISGKLKKYIGILRLDKLAGFYEYKVIEYDDRLVKVYLGLLGYFRYIQGFKDRKKKEEAKNEVNFVYTDIEKKFGIYKPEPKENWSKWHKEI